MSKEIFKEEKVITQHDVENKQLKEENEKVESRKVESRKEENEKLKKENEQLRKNNVDVKIKESIEKPIEIKSHEEDKNTTDWFDRNKFKEILAIIDSNKFNYRNKIGEFKYINNRDLVNNIRINTISKIDAKKDLNTLNKIKNAEIKYKRLIPKHKELLNLFNDLLDIILTDKTLQSESQEDKNNNENEQAESRKEENERVESRKEENEKVENRKDKNEKENSDEDDN